ncbi:unnamed protein product [Caenorhabditis brenneri]
MLGHGFFATVHKAEDTMTTSNVAVKIVRSDERDEKSAEKEIKFMKKIKEVSELGSNGTLAGTKNIVKLLDDFRIKEKQGIHVVMVFEVLCMDLYNLLNKSNQQKLTLNRIKRFSKNILEGLHFLRTKCKIMHLDIKPENLLVKADPDNMDLSDPSCNASLKIGDFGTSAWTTDNFTGSVQTCHYRAPEVFLGAKITPLADIWSFGCVLYEMAVRDLLFGCDDLDTCILKSHLSEISALLGPIEMRFFKKNKYNAAIFDEVFGKEKVFITKPAEINLISPKELMKHHSMTMSEADEYCEFIRELLMINPSQRLSAKEALKHPFFTEDCSEKCVALFLNLLVFLSAALYIPIVISIRKLLHLTSAQLNQPHRYVAWQLVVISVGKTLSVLAYLSYINENDLMGGLIYLKTMDAFLSPLVIQITYIGCNRRNLQTFLSSLTLKKFWKVFLCPCLSSAEVGIANGVNMDTTHAVQN